MRDKVMIDNEYFKIFNLSKEERYKFSAFIKMDLMSN